MTAEGVIEVASDDNPCRAFRSICPPLRNLPDAPIMIMMSRSRRLTPQATTIVASKLLRSAEMRF